MKLFINIFNLTLIVTHLLSQNCQASWFSFKKKKIPLTQSVRSPFTDSPMSEDRWWLDDVLPKKSSDAIKVLLARSNAMYAPKDTLIIARRVPRASLNASYYFRNNPYDPFWVANKKEIFNNLGLFASMTKTAIITDFYQRVISAKLIDEKYLNFEKLIHVEVEIGAQQLLGSDDPGDDKFVNIEVRQMLGAKISLTDEGLRTFGK